MRPFVVLVGAQRAFHCPLYFLRDVASHVTRALSHSY